MLAIALRRILLAAILSCSDGCPRPWGTHIHKNTHTLEQLETLQWFLFLVDGQFIHYKGNVNFLWIERLYSKHSHLSTWKLSKNERCFETPGIKTLSGFFCQVLYVSIQEASEHSHGGPRLISVPHNSGLHRKESGSQTLSIFSPISFPHFPTVIFLDFFWCVYISWRRFIKLAGL